MTESAIKSSRRVFEILEAFESTRRPMALKEFVERFGYPASSASALLKSLVALGYLDYDRFSRTYMPTMRIASLGHWVHGALFGEGHALRLMQHLASLTGETVTLASQSDLTVQYVYLIPSALPIWYRIPIGMSRPLALSGLGWLMLGVRTDGEIEALVRRMNFREQDPGKRIVLSGVPGFSAQTWIALVAPAGTPEPIVEKLNTELVQILASSEVRNKLESQGALPGGGSPADLATFTDSEIRKWAKVIKDGNIKPE